MELPDSLTPEHLQERIYATFALVRESMKTEIHGALQTVTLPVLQTVPQVPYFPVTKNGIPVSPNCYLLALTIQVFSLCSTGIITLPS
ncbi:MAG: hypothetical protein IJW17_08230 [Lentisphaeria bacterium]|nr:hypothetical protein [Lentisphaeria bacterium]